MYANGLKGDWKMKNLTYVFEGGVREIYITADKPKNEGRTIDVCYPFEGGITIIEISSPKNYNTKYN